MNSIGRRQTSKKNRARATAGRVTAAAVSAVMTLITTLLMLPVPEASSEATKLASGNKWFTTGHLDRQVLSPAECTTLTCPEYQLEVLSTNANGLRVGFTAPYRSDILGLEVYHHDTQDGPKTRVTEFEGDQGDATWFGYSGDSRILNPAAGFYTIRVLPWQIQSNGTPYKLRAKLEATPSPAPKDPEARPPNLRVIPPHDPSFHSPANPAAPSSPEFISNEPANPAKSCLPEEMAPDPR